MCVVYSYTLIHNNADKLLSSCLDQPTPRPPSQETSRASWPAPRASREAVVASVTEAEEVVSAVATEAVSVEETEVDVSYRNLYI